MCCLQGEGREQGLEGSGPLSSNSGEAAPRCVLDGPGLIWRATVEFLVEWFQPRSGCPRPNASEAAAGENLFRPVRSC